MSDPTSSDRPHLEAVRENAEDAEIVESGEAPATEAGARESADSDQAQKQGGRASGTIIVLLCLTLAVCVFVMLAQARQTEQLQGQVVAMGEEIVVAETALASAEAELARQEALIGQVRQGVSELLQSAGALSRLVQAPLEPIADETLPAEPIAAE